MRTFNNLQGAKEYVREKADLLQIISEDVGDIDWKEESRDTFVCCSPFRDEANPSFKVNKNRFKDWGGEQYSGDIFTWVQLWHNLSFSEAVAHVASRFNIDIGSYYRNPTREEIQKARYIKINNLAAEMMHKWLRENIQIRDDYLARSGFSLDQIEPYQVGYCISRDLLISSIASQLQISQDEVDILEFSRGDLFTNAIVYPVHNQYGEVVGFYTKQLGIADATYKGNKADHPLHDQSVLYGMHVARRDIRKNNGQLVIVEGFRDAIAIKAAGCMGSSITDPQLESLKQYKLKTIIALYDGDKTGWIKSLELVNKPKDTGDALLLVARPELDKDPHDVWKEGGDEAIYALLLKAELPIEHYAKSLFADADGEFSHTTKARLLSDIREFLIGVSGVHLDMAADYLAKAINSTKEAVIDYIAEIKVLNNNLYNIEAERSLIAYCLENPSALSSSRAAGVSAECFTKPHFAKLFKACVSSHSIYGDNYTPQVVVDEVMAKSPDPELPSVVVKIQDGNYKYTEAAACEKVIDMWRRRIASEQASKLITSSRDLSQSFVTIVESHRKNLINTTSSSRQQARTPQQLSMELYNEVKERSMSGGNLIIGHSFHQLPSVNMVLGGIQPQYTVVGGDSGSGKSILAMNIAKCIAIDANIPTLWIGQEMRSKDNMMRLASIITGIDNAKIQSGSLTQREAALFRSVTDTIARSGIYYAKPSEGHIDEVLSIVDEYRWKYGIQAVIWDYIQLVTSAPGQDRASREQVIGYASKVITNKIVGDMGLAAIIVAQLNRDKMSQGQHKIAGSYQIVQDCDNFVYIEKKTKKQIKEDGEGKGNRKIIIGKRRGGVSDFQIDAQFAIDPGDVTLRIKECTTFSDIGRLHSTLAA